jgi:hypothetical protein
MRSAGEVEPSHGSRSVSVFECVYFFQAPCGLIKIGRAINPEKRLKDLSSMCPVPLRVLGAFRVADAPAEEHGMHLRFHSYRSHGEWFLPTQEIMEHIVLRAETVCGRKFAELQFFWPKDGRVGRFGSPYGAGFGPRRREAAA